MPLSCISRLLTLAAAVACGTLASCESSNAPRPKPLDVKPLVVRDVPAVLRGTVGTETTISGTQPVLISGYGFVVGLNGTGGGALPDKIAGSLERQMGLLGIGRAERYDGYAISGRTPKQLLKDKNTAVVLVQAAIAPGAPASAHFDVFVTALNATNLEGGILWTTDLQVGDPALVGGIQSRKIAVARGPIFINPFSDPGKETAGVTRFAGRVLDGGTVLNPFPLEIRLDNPSHSRAITIKDAINERFDPGMGDPGEVARGRNDSMIELNVPRRFAKTPGQFLDLVQAITIDQFAPAEELAKRYVDALKAQPALATPLSRSLEALGRPERTLPQMRELYDFPESEPRMAALRAGANLGDVRAAAPLQKLARNGNPAERASAIDLLSRIGGGPMIDVTLREMLADPDLAIRIGAYEALMRRAVRVQTNRLAESNPRAPVSHLEVLAETNVPPGLLQGVSRQMISGKFFLDVVATGEPLIYITQQGQPRIVLFGANLDLTRPMLANIWSSRLLIASDAPTDPIRIRYEDATGRARTASTSGTIVDLITLLAQDPSPEESTPSLGLSYSEIVGVLYELQQQKYLGGPFTTERDRLQAQIYAAAKSGDRRDRPETTTDKEEIVIINQPGLGARPTIKSTDEAPKQVPITEPAEPKKN